MLTPNHGPKFEVRPGFRLEEVALRDGLQRLAPCPPTQIVQLAKRIYQAGIHHIEVGSLVNPKIVPALAGTLEVMARLSAEQLPDLQMSVLIPRAKAFSSAAAAGVAKVAVAISQEEKFQEENWHNTIQEGMAQLEQIYNLREQNFPSCRIKAYLMMAWSNDCPLIEDLSRLAFLRDIADEVCLADTAARATPENFRSTLKTAATIIPLPQLSLHLHGKPSVVLDLGRQAAEFGIRSFDTALGGLGGCPFLDSPAANADTRLFNKMLQQFGPHQGGDIKDDDLQDAERLLREMIGLP
jgi:hydroxymethylglutaryl-CoA lyase